MGHMSDWAKTSVGVVRVYIWMDGWVRNIVCHRQTTGTLCHASLHIFKDQSEEEQDSRIQLLSHPEPDSIAKTSVVIFMTVLLDKT